MQETAAIALKPARRSRSIWERARRALPERLTRNWSPNALQSHARAPLVSFSFDDFPHSAASSGARILNEFGIKGTYFVASGRAGRNVDGLDHFTEDDLLEVADAGHEIGCHTFGHLRLLRASRSEIEDDLLRNKEFIHRVLGDYTMSSFAYPYGEASIAIKALMARHFPICRGIWARVNKGKVDFAQLKAVPLAQPFDQAQVSNVLDDATASNGWVIFFTHDVSDDPSEYGCKPAELARVAQDVLARGIEVLPIKNAAAKVSFS